jgi:hypothetical protein
MTSGPGDTETDTGVESVCSEIEPESTAVIERLGRYDTSECESEDHSESLGSHDTSECESEDRSESLGSHDTSECESEDLSESLGDMDTSGPGESGSESSAVSYSALSNASTDIN